MCPHTHTHTHTQNTQGRRPVLERPNEALIKERTLYKTYSNNERNESSKKI